MLHEQLPQPRGIQFREPPIFERGAPGRSGSSLAPLDVPAVDPGARFGALARKAPAGLPEVSEPEAFRHFVRLSQWNFCIDSQLYPLGSCTMKYNPKVNEWAARIPGFLHLHPLTPDALAQGTLEIMWRLAGMLCEVSGMDGCSLQPSAGAQGELTGLMMIRAYHAGRAAARPKKVLIPESAHGTNPATCALNGLTAVKIDKSADGVVHPEEVLRAIEREAAGGDLCGLMITNPNTLGVYETPPRRRSSKLVHEQGGLVYGDGANTNAIMGAARPGDIGIDVIHINLHKTFTTPHGGGGPGSGPVCFKKHLEPVPALAGRRREATGRYALDYDRPQSIGRVRAFQGNFGMFVRAYTYIREMGGDGLKMASTLAVLNARYLWARLKDHYAAPIEQPCMHEVVLSDRELEKRDGRQDARRGQAAHRLRLPRPDRLLPPGGARRPDDRAHRDRDQGDPRRVRRRDAGHPERGPRDARAGQGGPPPHRRRPAWTRPAPPGNPACAGRRRSQA